MRPSDVKDARSGLHVLMAVSLVALLSCTYISQAAVPMHSASDVLVKGPNEQFEVTVVLMARDNATYHVEVSDVEAVTEKFTLIDNGTSEKKAIANGVTYNFSMGLTSLDASAGETTKVPYEVYMNDVLVSQGIVNVTVENPLPDGPQTPTCNTCGLIIPLFMVGPVFIVMKRAGKRRKLE